MRMEDLPGTRSPMRQSVPNAQGMLLLEPMVIIHNAKIIMFSGIAQGVWHLMVFFLYICQIANLLSFS